LFHTAAARAAEESVWISYDAPAVCPDQAAFYQRVRSRTDRGRFTDSGEITRALEISIREDHARYVGSIAFFDEEGHIVSRRVRGATCDEVASSLALITALTIEAHASEVATEDPEQPETALEALAEPAPPAPLPSPLAELADPIPEPADEPSRGRSAVHWTAGASAGAVGWVAPSASIAWGAFAEVVSRRARWNARLSVFYAHEHERVAVGAADFSTVWARLEACPLRVSPVSELAFGVCLGIDAGRLRAAGQNGAQLTDATSANVVWAAGVGLARISWDIEQRWVIGLDGELAAPLVRHEFVFGGQSAPVFAVPAIGAGGNVTAGLRFQ